MDIALFTIVGGHELVGKIVFEDDRTMIIEHPLVIRPVQKGPNQYALELFPHSLANPEGNHTFMKQAFVSQSKAPTELETAYVERTTNIILSSTLRDMEAMQ